MLLASFRQWRTDGGERCSDIGGFGSEDRHSTETVTRGCEHQSRGAGLARSCEILGRREAEDGDTLVPRSDSISGFMQIVVNVNQVFDEAETFGSVQIFKHSEPGSTSDASGAPNELCYY